MSDQTDNLLEFAKVQKLLESDKTISTKQKAKIIAVVLKEKQININGGTSDAGADQALRSS